MTDMDKMMIEPCPFCGSAELNEKTHSQPWGDEGADLFQGYVECDMCGARGPQTPWYDNHEDALSKLREMLNDEGWNTRAYNPDDRLSQEVENLTHDLERQMTIANMECNLAEDAREALRQCRRLAAMETSALAKAIIETVDTALSPLPQGDG